MQPRPAMIEIARILLLFEIECQQKEKAAAESAVYQAGDKATTTDQPKKVNRQRNSTPMPDNCKKAKMSASDSN